MAEVSKLRANINGVFETFDIKDATARENDDQLKNAVDALKIVDTASGAIASFPDGAAMPTESLTVEMSPIQDLNGQANPYPAGGGKNLLDIPDSESQTAKGVTWRFENGLLYINGTGTAGQMLFTVEVTYPSDTYTFSAQLLAGSISGVNSSFNGYTSGDVREWLVSYGASGVSVSMTRTNDIARINANFNSGSIFNNAVIGFQVERGSSTTPWSPYSNICPITGRDSVTVTRTGKNLFDKSEVVDGVYINDVDGAERQSADSKATGWIPVVPGEKYYILTEQTMGAWGAWYDRNKAFVGGITGYLPSGSQREHTAPSNAAYMRLTCYRSGSGNIDTFAVNHPSTDHDYHAYDGQSATIQLGQTVYGGTVDVTTGVMTVTDAMVDLGSMTWTKLTNYNYGTFSSGPLSNCAYSTTLIYCMSDTYKAESNSSASIAGDNYVWIRSSSGRRAVIKDTSKADMTVGEFKTAMSGKTFVYKLETPLTITLTPEQMSTLKGQNNVWSDADSVTVDYVADPKLYIARLTEPDADMVADANITSGKYFMVSNTLYLATSNIASGAAIVPGVNCTRTNLASALNAINA